MSKISDATNTVVNSMNQSFGGIKGLTSEQTQQLQKLKDAGAGDAQVTMQALQMSMENMSQLNNMISNMMKKLSEMADTAIRNMR